VRESIHCLDTHIRNFDSRRQFSEWLSRLSSYPTPQLSASLAFSCQAKAEQFLGDPFESRPKVKMAIAAQNLSSVRSRFAHKLTSSTAPGLQTQPMNIGEKAPKNMSRSDPPSPPPNPPPSPSRTVGFAAGYAA
jgi:hypothetical protein